MLSISENTLDVHVNTQAGPVKISFFGGLDIYQVEIPDIAKDNGIAIASAIDIFGMKCLTVLKRAELKDYQDIHALITDGQLPLATGIGAAQAIYGKQFNPIDTLKALTYFNDLPAPLSQAQQRDLMHAVRATDVAKIPYIKAHGNIGSGIESR